MLSLAFNLYVQTMKFAILFTILITISEAISDSLLTGSYHQNSTAALINDRRDVKEIDVLRQLVNQETLIRVSVTNDVRAAVDDVISVKRSLLSTETTVATLLQTIETLKRQDNSLSQKIEKLTTQIDALKQNNTVQQTTEAIKREVDFLRGDRALQNAEESLKRYINTQKREDMNSLENCQNRFQELDKKFKILTENITNIYQYLGLLEKDFKLTRDCRYHYLLGHTQSGKYEINPFGNETSVSVYCDMVTDGGGWTAIQKRVSGSVSFDRNWTDYKTGFGNPNGSYWIGNDVIHQLTKRRNSSLYVSITLTNGTRLYELYNQFSVANETNKYRLFLGGPATGTLGDSIFNTGNSNKDLSGMYFTTPDRDNDRYGGVNCAALSDRRGGWWFNACHRAFLNGQWSPESWDWPWYPTVTDGKQIKETLMMIKHN
ncbi:fibroleukin-like isoform X2 [Saccostrea cucullata]|uniref:fibroleukin-like isoform X2 n=1 Tax=Saccostrea cuccullata TaxID=36930 RepID=UPI002ED19D3F